MGVFTGTFRELERSDDLPWPNTGNASSLSNEEKIKCLNQFSHTHCSNNNLILTLVSLKLEKLELDVKISCGKFYIQGMMQCVADKESPFDIQPPFGLLKVFVFFTHYCQ